MTDFSFAQFQGPCIGLNVRGNYWGLHAAYLTNSMNLGFGEPWVH
jgi:hypothetical protein